MCVYVCVYMSMYICILYVNIICTHIIKHIVSDVLALSNTNIKVLLINFQDFREPVKQSLFKII